MSNSEQQKIDGHIPVSKPDANSDPMLRSFLGYRRAKGRPGVRNQLLILNATGLTEPTARRVCQSLPSAVLASTPYGMGMLGEDLSATLRSLRGLVLSPNAGAVLVLSADRPRCDAITQVLESQGKPYHAIAFDDVGHDSLKMTEEAIRVGANLIWSISRQSRESFPVSELYLALECGLSDPTSGLVANPLMGRITDSLVSTGATAVIGETLEWLGAEDTLVHRGANRDVSNSIREAVLRREKMAQTAGIELRDVNPNRANIEAGLSTIEEKASGSVAKSGSCTIQSILEYAERPNKPGLYVMDAPSYTPESLTGFAASGAQIALFSTGLGNSYVSALMPTIKITGNDATAKRLSHQIDYSCAGVLSGSDQNESTQELLAEIIAVASGAKTYGEILAEGSECISRFGASL